MVMRLATDRIIAAIGYRFAPHSLPIVSQPMPRDLRAQRITTPAPVLILKTGRYAVIDDQLGVIRNLGWLGVPVCTVAEDHLTLAGIHRYLTDSFVRTRDRATPQML
jgi:hypothetical protein